MPGSVLTVLAGIVADVIAEVVSGPPAAAPSPAPTPGGLGESLRSAGPLALLVTGALAVALFLLVRSMNRQFRRVDYDATGESDEERMRRDEP